ncbi:hypothetical protein AACH28_23205 [Sphingobacterium thalpophilum]|uniref:Uncharacterized protein n=1 Tax=Sphingobacterium thalpophilum TaxID=259 RepID=A0ACD5C184_9SPHI
MLIASISPEQRFQSTDFLLGYVPKYDTDRAKLTLTLRQSYTPWKIKLNKQFTYHPLRTGAYLNTTLGKQFWYKEPDKYPNSYYRFSTRLRINIFVGQDFSYKIKSSNSYFEGVKFYYDLHTSDITSLAPYRKSIFNLMIILASA